MPVLHTWWGGAEMLIEWNFTKVVLTGLWEFSNDFGL